MIGNSTACLHQGLDSDMLPNFYIKVSNKFTIIGFKFKELISGAVYKFQCCLCNEHYYGECVRHLNVRIRNHTGILPLTKVKIEAKSSVVNDQLLRYNHSPHHLMADFVC